MEEFENEAAWEDRLTKIMAFDYGHEVYNQIHYRNGKDRGILDIYVITSPEWEHQKTFPVIGIECKLPKKQGMGGIIDSVLQMKRYMSPDCMYYQNGRRIESPSICLIATPESWHESEVYIWTGDGTFRTDPCCLYTMTYLFERILMKNRCSILLNKRFHSNIEGGAIRSYYMGQ